MTPSFAFQLNFTFLYQSLIYILLYHYQAECVAACWTCLRTSQNFNVYNIFVSSTAPLPRLL